MPSNRAVAARAEVFLVIAAVAGLVIVAFAFAPGLEMFRTAKEAVLRTQAIVSALALATAVAFGGTERLRAMLRDRAVVAILASVLVWTAISTLTSGNRILSIESFASICCSLLLFVAIWYIAPKFPVVALLVLVPAAIINVALSAMQEYQIWSPFEFGEILPAHLAATAMIGNPNDVGCYLALCAVVLLLAGEALRGWPRTAASIGGVIAFIGVFVSQTRTAILALAATAFVVGLRRSRRLALAIVGAMFVTLLIAYFVDLGAVSRLAHMPKSLARGQWNVVFSDRLPAFAAALAMFGDHPLFGVGPGAYKYFYFGYRVRLIETYPEAIMGSAGVNFAEVHNDHLQLLAETGLPGYALFVAACVVIALRARRTNTETDQARLAAQLALPFVVVVAVMALAFFPLQIAATRHLLITVAALIAGWSRT